MELKPSFFTGMKKMLLVLIIVGIIASILSFILLPQNYAQLFGYGILILTVNVALMFLFVRVNDKKRPKYREKQKEEKRFDFRK